MKYIATYNIETLTDSKEITVSDNPSRIYVENIGAVNAKINNQIPLEANSGIGRIFKEEPGVVIGTPLSIVFDASGDTRVLVVKTYYKEV